MNATKTHILTSEFMTTITSWFQDQLAFYLQGIKLGWV